MSRKKIQQILKELDVKNAFTLRKVSFIDLARDTAKVLTIKDWTPSIKAVIIHDRFKDTGVIVEFKGTGFIC